MDNQEMGYFKNNSKWDIICLENNLFHVADFTILLIQQLHRPQQIHYHTPGSYRILMND